MALNAYKTCTTDVTTGIFETTLVPETDLNRLVRQQRELDGFLQPLLDANGLMLVNVETPLLTEVSRENYYLFHTYWRSEYGLRRTRGEDHYWFSWTIGNNPTLEVNVDEAIPFLNVVLRATGATVFLRRAGSISRGEPRADSKLTVRPSAYRQLWSSSPYPEDRFRSAMLGRDFRGWYDYMSTIFQSPTVVLIGDDGTPMRVTGDPRFEDLLLRRSEPWQAWTASGEQLRINEPVAEHIHGLQRGLLFSRLRWAFRESMSMDAFRDAYIAGEDEIREFLGSELSTLYIEVRSDACPPPAEEAATLAMYAGWLENFEEVRSFVLDETSHAFWENVFIASESQPFDSKVDNIWMPELILGLLEMSRKGLVKSGRNEEHLLDPLISRCERCLSPAEEAVELFRQSPNSDAGLRAVVERFKAF